MPKKKQKEKKGPVPVKIHAEHDFSSPHLLNLRENILDLQIQTGGQSMEEKAEALDRRVREVPDFLKSRVASFSRLWDRKAGSLFNQALDLGLMVHKRIADTARFTTKTIRRRRTINISIKEGLPQFAIIFILVLVITIPIQGLLIYRSINGFQTNLATYLNKTNKDVSLLASAISARELSKIYNASGLLQNDISGLRMTLDKLGILKAFLPDKFKFANSIVRVSERGIASLHQLTSQAMDLQTSNTTPGDIIRTAEQELSIIVAQLDSLLQKHSTAKMIEPFINQLRAGNDIMTVISNLYGSKDQKNILFIFQNPRELRATGGFAGSFALATVRDGIIESIESPEGGTYAIQGQLEIERISPKPLHLINPKFEFQDANWWPNFPNSAKKITELFETAGGASIDSVIAITARVGEDILNLHGPIETEHGNISSSNFIDILQETIVKDRIQDRSAPKKIITALLPAIQKATVETAAQQPKELMSVLLLSLGRKDIQIWAKNENTQAAIERLGWSGKLSKNNGDYLSIITSNVGGGKTDGVVSEDVNHNVHISNGIAYETLSIKRTHNGRLGDKFNGHKNNAYLRIYVPENARLIEISGNAPPDKNLFEKPGDYLIPDPDVRINETTKTIDAKSSAEIWNENGKKVFGVWLITTPGEQKEVVIKYEIPISSNSSLSQYSLTVDPQGGKQSNFNSKITLDNNTKTLTGSENGEWNADGWTYNGILDKTLVASGVFYKL